MTSDHDRCPKCWQPTTINYEVDDDALLLGEEIVKEGVSRDWFFMEDLETIVYGAPLPGPKPPDEDLIELVKELDKEFPYSREPLGPPLRPDREPLRKLLYALGWRHVPLRTLSNEHTQRRELWTRPLSMHELVRREGNKPRQEHGMTQVLGEYLGRRLRQSHYQQDFAFNSQTRQKQMGDILAHLREVKIPQWNAQIAAAIGTPTSTSSVLLSYLHGTGKVVRYSYDPGHLTAAYVARQYAHLFVHTPVEELSPIDDLDDMDLYEQLSKILHGHTAIPQSLLHRQFPNVRPGLLDSVMDQFGWRQRRFNRTSHWVSPEHPHFSSIQPSRRLQDAEIEKRRELYQESPDEFEDDLLLEDGELFLEPAIAPVEEERPVIVAETPIAKSKPVINGEATVVLEFMKSGGMLAPRDIAKGTAIPTRRVNVLLSELLELGKVMKFPMGKTEAYVAR